MTHQVLARKWRPRTFQEVVGQIPVVRALTNALDQNRLHHAYLFTGTRGVGKTSLARLLAKCLNCQKGVSSQPCGECDICQAIDSGRFLDLLEVDAASRTKVEDTRDLLDNVQYAPTQGRYKIYLIDEVHMLSNHSFNALLKTLEEPPPHVKFLLATTDPQKLPVTVLSRCLQFHLKNLSIEQIAKQLAYILDAESFNYEASALNYLAHAAQGSMRDALSLLDQAIAYSNGSLGLAEVKTLLGATEPELLISLLRQLVNNKPQSLLEEIYALAESGIDFQHALEELLSILHQIALTQAIPEAQHEHHYPIADIIELAQAIEPEELQLYYQIGLMGRRDLPLAPTPRSGFEMTLLRMLAFRPQKISITAFLANAAQQPLNSSIKKNSVPTQIKSAPANVPANLPIQGSSRLENPYYPHASKHDKLTSSEKDQANKCKKNEMTSLDWVTLLPKLELQGAASMLASNCILTKQTEELICLGLDPDHASLLNSFTESQLLGALEKYFNKQIRLTIEIDKSDQQTPALLDKQHQEQRQCEATDALAHDKNLQLLIEQFNGKIIPASIKPVD